MSFTKRSILYAALALMPLSQAAANPIFNGEIGYVSLQDGEEANLVGWSIESGAAGSTNPSESEFYGEADKGAQGNTMYMKDDAKVSQFIFHVVSSGTLYTLSFDVGYPVGQTPQDYIVKVETSNGAPIEVLNPVRLTKPGEFEEVKLQFTNRETMSGLYTVYIETQGTGELHFDNFDMSEINYNRLTPAHLKTVAYGNSLYSAENNSYTCEASYSLSDDGFGQTPYLSSGDGDCRCVNSITVNTNETDYPSGDFRTYYQCRTSTQ